MKTNGHRTLIYRGILLLLLSLYFLLVFGRSGHESFPAHYHTAFTSPKLPEYRACEIVLPKLLSFEGTSSKNEVKLNWKFETTDGLEECILERAEKSSEFKPVAYFFMTEDIQVPNLKYTDRVPKQQTYHYRLKLTGKDGEKRYTKVLTFNIHTNQNEKKCLAYPSVIE
jgi:hypothetical protein